MGSKSRYWLVLAMLACATARAQELQTSAEIPREILSNDRASVEFTKDIGGRILSYHLAGRDNVLLLSEAVKHEVMPRHDVDAPFIQYNGAIVWLGPQSDWWKYQTLNLVRRLLAPEWPPDPYLIYADNALTHNSGTSVSLRGIDSPVSGVRVDKDIALQPDGSLYLRANMTNVSDSPVNWDLWFLARVSPDARVYVPSADPDTMRIQDFQPELYDRPAYSFVDGLLSLAPKDVAADRAGRQGKFMLGVRQPWIASFYAGQLLLISFEKVPPAYIHPRQAPVELYVNQDRNFPAIGVIELETHSALRELYPGETFSAWQHWYLFDYSGSDDEAEQIAFLRSVLGDGF